MAVISGHVQFMIETAGTIMSQIQSGNLRALAVSGDHKMAELPDIPTMQQAGVRDYVYSTWYGLWTPGRTSNAIVTKLNRAVAKVLAKTEAKAALEKAGIEATSTTPERFGEIVSFDLKKWTRIIRDAGITPQ
jgi:tripartite-type tricarboxylate transporter receptor subunit TctC